MNEIITRKWRDGKVISETKKQVDWEPNEADLDCVTISCECGNSFEMPRDAMFGLSDMHCGWCNEIGKWKLCARSE